MLQAFALFKNNSQLRRWQRCVSPYLSVAHATLHPVSLDTAHNLLEVVKRRATFFRVRTRFALKAKISENVTLETTVDPAETKLTALVVDARAANWIKRIKRICGCVVKWRWKCEEGGRGRGRSTNVSDRFTVIRVRPNFVLVQVAMRIAKLARATARKLEQLVVELRGGVPDQIV